MKVIQTKNAPEAIGPYSQAIRTGDFLYTSGQIPLIPGTKELKGNDIESQTEQVLANVKAVLEEAGLTLQNVLKTTVFMKNLGDFPRMNAVYSRIFGDHRPARSTVEVSRLPMDSLVEIEVIATTLK